MKNNEQQKQETKNPQDATALKVAQIGLIGVVVAAIITGAAEIYSKQLESSAQSKDQQETNAKQKKPTLIETPRPTMTETRVNPLSRSPAPKIERRTEIAPSLSAVPTPILFDVACEIESVTEAGMVYPLELKGGSVGSLPLAAGHHILNVAMKNSQLVKIDVTIPHEGPLFVTCK